MCLARGQSLQGLIGKFSHVADADDSNFGNRLTGICLIIPELKNQALEITQLSERSPDIVADAKTILYSGVSVDQELNTWATANPWLSQYDVLQTSSISWLEESEYPHGVHLYQDLASAAIWNNYRIARIQLNINLLRILRWLGPHQTQRFEEQYKSRMSVIQRMVDEVSASIPYHLGNRQPRMDREFVQFLTASGVTVDDNTWTELFHKATGTLPAPLLTCLEADGCIPDEQRNWISAQVTRVYQVMKNTSSTELSDIAHNIGELSFLHFSRAVDVR